MRNHLVTGGLFLALCFTHFTGLAQATTLKAKHRDDRILIMPKPGVSFAELAELHGREKTGLLKMFDGIRGLQVVHLPPGESVARAIARYQQSGLVEFAEPDYEIELYATPNDPKYLDGTQWALNNTGQSGGTPDADIDAPEAWDVRSSASNIVVAVIDTGVRYTHEDLAPNMWTNSDGSFGWNAIANSNNPGEDSGGSHGTQVAGILGSAGNNGKGIAGVAWKVQIMACKSFNSVTHSGSISDAVTCLDFARTNGARIVNASWGFNPDSAALSNAVLSCRDAGIIVVAAAGNSTQNIDLTPSYPANYPFDNIVSVAYTTRTDTLAAASNFGATNVDLAAPGEQIHAPFAALDNFYLNSTGSSMAAPFVSGTLALMLAKFPGETHQQIIARLLAATDPLPSLAGKCVTGGRLNARKALSPDILLTPLALSPFQFSVSAGPNRQCVVERSTNLTTWTAGATNITSANGTFNFTNNLVAPPQFFRVSAAP
jgi:subtilisin family serine protease